MNRIIDILVLVCAAWILVASFLYRYPHYANIAATIIIVLQVIKLSWKKS